MMSLNLDTRSISFFSPFSSEQGLVDMSCKDSRFFEYPLSSGLDYFFSCFLFFFKKRKSDPS